MKKENIDWSIDMKRFKFAEDDEWIVVEICETKYIVDTKTACIAHCLLLLVDSINDKDFK